MNDGKVVSITFRITENYKNCLDMLINEAKQTSVSDFLNTEIYLLTREYILRSAMQEARLIVCKEFHVSERVTNAIYGPIDLESIIPDDTGKRFRERWFCEFKKAEATLIKKYKLHDDISLLSSDSWSELISFYFDSYPNLKLFHTALIEGYDLSIEEIKEKKASTKSDD